GIRDRNVTGVQTCALPILDRPATSVLLPAWAGVFTNDIVQPGHDITRAKALLAEAGWTDTNHDGVLDKDGQPLSLVIRTHSEDPDRKSVVELLVRSEERRVGKEC